MNPEAPERATSPTQTPTPVEPVIGPVAMGSGDESHPPAKQKSKLSVLNIVLIIVTLLALGVAGYYYHQSSLNKTATITKTVTETVTDIAPNPYSGWTQFCSAVEGTCFKYPSTWKADITSANTSSSTDPTGDSVVLTSPSGFHMSFSDGEGSSPGSAPTAGCQDIYFSKVIESPNISGLSIVEAQYGSSGSTSVIGLTDSAVKIGNTGSCIFIPSFTSPNKTSSLAKEGFVIDSFSNAPIMSDGNNSTPISSSDLSNAVLILESYSQ